MKKWMIILAAVMLLLLSGSGFTMAKEDSLEDLNQKISEKKQQLKEGKKEEKEMMDSLVELEQTIDELDTEIGSSEQRLEKLTKQLKKAEKQVKKQNRDLEKRLRSMYKNGSAGFLDVLLHSGSFSDFLTNLDMVERILKNDEDVLKDLQKAHDRIEAKKAEVEKLQDELTAARATASQERGEVAKEKERLAEINKQTADDIGDLEAERERLEAELAAKSASGDISNSKSSKYKGGAFLWPLPASTTVTSEYGWRNCPFHGREFHAAIDIGDAPTGSAIVASASGKVIQAGWNGGFGNSVIIDHGGGLTTQYNHCSSVSVSEGQKVKRGETIAALGSTGYSTGPHLDFRVYRDGVVQNPWSFL